MILIRELTFFLENTVFKRQNIFSLLIGAGIVVFLVAAEKYQNSPFLLEIIIAGIFLIFIGLVGTFYDLVKQNTSTRELYEEEEDNEVDLKKIKDLIENVRPHITVNTDEGTKVDLINELKEVIIKNVDDEQSKKPTNNLDIAKKIGSNLFAAQNRLRKEVENVERRAGKNLIIGTIISLIGIGVLGWVVFSIDPSVTTWEKQLSQYGPRVLLGVMVQFFAFFFLKLYRNGLSELRYYQNEITNLNSRYTALKASFYSEDSELQKIIITDLSKTERNFILEKGQSTTEIRKEEISSASEASRYQTVADIISKIVPSQQR